MTTKTAIDDTQTEHDRQWEHIGESEGCSDHDHDMIRDIGRRLEALWCRDQVIANAAGRQTLQTSWGDFKAQEIKKISRLRSVMKDEIQNGCI